MELHELKTKKLKGKTNEEVHTHTRKTNRKGSKKKRDKTEKHPAEKQKENRRLFCQTP
jgi:hypothetical protein